jgi:hypothetical protein
MAKLPVGQFSKRIAIIKQCMIVLDFGVFFFSFSTGVGTQGLMLAKQALYHLSHSTSLVLCWMFLR